MSEITEYNLPVNAYASFDARSMRDFIIDRLNNNSSISFTDQNFQGSNLNGIIDIIAYSFHTLLFYLNQTSSEALFSDAQLYENMNRIVKLIDYKPLGKQTSIVPMNLQGTINLSSGYYTLPKFSFVTSNGKTYSTTQDITFRKNTNSTVETLSTIGNNLFYEGKYREFPNVDAIGEDFETITLLPGDNLSVDHFSIKVFIKENNDSKWYEYKRVPTLYMHNPNERVFECRLNQNKNYEITFGNNINGKRLQLNETIAIYYIASSGTEGQITKNTFNNSPINIFNTTKYNEIFADTKDSTLSYITVNDSVNINASNTEDSTLYSEEESVNDIRNNAPKFYSSEYRLVTIYDYENFINTNFKNFVYDVKVINNSDYLNSFKNYISDDLKLSSYTDYNNALFNQYTFADSFDVNNVFLIIVPKFKKNNSVVTRSNYISTSLKNEIVNEIRKFKLLNSEITFLDPVYLSVDLFLKDSNELNNTSFIDFTELRFVKNSTSIANDNTIINKALSIIVNYFSNSKLGQLIDIKQLNNDLNSIEGVDSFYTYRSDTGLRSNGINLAVYNPVYNGIDLKAFDTNYKLKYFQIPFIENIDNLKSKIVVETTNQSKSIIEY